MTDSSDDFRDVEDWLRKLSPAHPRCEEAADAIATLRERAEKAERLAGEMLQSQHKLERQLTASQAREAATRAAFQLIVDDIESGDDTTAYTIAKTALASSTPQENTDASA